MRASSIRNEDAKYLRFDADGKATLESRMGNDMDYNYRKVHYTHEDKLKSSASKDIFRDPEFLVDDSDLEDLIPGRKVVLKRLYDLYRHYPEKNRPEFFSVKGYRFDRITNAEYLPSFATEIGLFPVQHYRSLFITQDFQKNGLYQIVINQNGRWETDVVDDWVPVFDDTREPIWGLDLEHSWQIILLKFWAKKNGCYKAVKEGAPFEFIECFSNCNWKYFNLSREGANFLDLYTTKFQYGKFVLKTKNSNAVKASGLIPGSAGYEIIHIAETSKSSKLADKRWTITIRSTLINKWAGQKSILDDKVNQLYNSEIKKRHVMALERDFVIEQRDFTNLFSACWVSSVRQKEHYFSSYHLLSFPQDFKNSVYMEFQVDKYGWFDFCIRQHDDIAIMPTKRSSLRAREEQQAQGRQKNINTRYLKCKFLLAREMNEDQKPREQHWRDYKNPKWELYEVEYLHGYNRGDARFVELIPGRYILKIKPEHQKLQPISSFVLHYSSNVRFDLKEVSLQKKEASLMLRHSLVSLIEDLKNYSLDSKKRYEQICFACLFHEIGYAFVAVRSKTNCPYNILIEVDPQQLERQGLRCKNQFKSNTEPFSVLVKPGESTSIVFKKIVETDQIKEWPPKGVNIFKSKN